MHGIRNQEKSRIQVCPNSLYITLNLALINRAGGLYGRILTERCEVCTSDRGQDSLIQTDLARLIRCLLHMAKQESKGRKT